MWLLWTAIILFIVWIVCLGFAQTVTLGMWILLAFVVAFLLAHWFVRRQMKGWQLKP
jgi:hypothetical protein